MQKNKTRLLIYIYKQMNSKGIEDLNIRSEIIQSLEEYLGDNILNIASMIIFFLIWLQRQGNKFRNKQIRHYTKKLLHMREPITKVKGKPTEYKRIFENIQ